MLSLKLFQLKCPQATAIQQSNNHSLWFTWPDNMSFQTIHQKSNSKRQNAIAIGHITTTTRNNSSNNNTVVLSYTINSTEWDLKSDIIIWITYRHSKTERPEVAIFSFSKTCHYTKGSIVRPLRLDSMSEYPQNWQHEVESVWFHLPDNMQNWLSYTLETHQGVRRN